jgi:hypothetical protein
MPAEEEVNFSGAIITLVDPDALQKIAAILYLFAANICVSENAETLTVDSI